ncbi:23S rRNA (guanosine(2251)-2'-O)-methyltransferase RlmB [Patescibacteria group bacterium]|mgnify:CR=1 FL=1|nr:23S rRNA (guanosine(2251)-2'-O)-methyltransferase RlmB [Patescibacteria group bacterium]
MKTKGDSFYIYGKKPVEEQLMRNPANVMRLFISDAISKKEGGFQELRKFAKEHNIPINPVTRNKIQDYVSDVNDQGVVALLRRADYTEYEDWEHTLDDNSLSAVVILDHIEDVHNFGAILRSAAAAGISAVIVAKDRQAPINGVTYKTSAGALLSLPVIRVSNVNQVIERLKKKKFWIAAVDMSDPTSKTDTNLWSQIFDTPIAFVLGAEGKGISAKTREHADFIISIPMAHDIESLNVSVAAAVVMFEWQRQMSLRTKK